MATFGGVTFTVLDEGYDRSQGVEITEVHIPYGDVTETFVGGKLPKKMHYTLLLDSEADYLALEALEGSWGALNCPDGTGTAMLRLIKPMQVHPDGHWKAATDWQWE